MSWAKRLPQALRQLRNERGLKQREVAAATGRQVQTVSNWETGRTDIPVSALEAYLEALGFGLRDLHRAIRALDVAKHKMLAGQQREAKLYEKGPDKPLSLAEQEQVRREVQLAATRGVKLVLAARGWSPEQAARQCGWAKPFRLTETLKRGNGWTLEKLAIISAAAEIGVVDLLRLGYQALTADRDRAKRRLLFQDQAERLLTALRGLPAEKRRELVDQLKTEHRTPRDGSGFGRHCQP